MSPNTASLASLLLAALALAAPAAAAPSTPAPARSAAPAASAASGLAARVDALVEALKDPARRSQARAEIVAIGTAATPALLARRQDPDFTVRWEMANVQGDIRDERAIPGLVDNAVADADPHIRWRSLWALREYPRELHERTRALLRGELEGKDGSRRWNAAVGLSMFEDASVVPALEEGTRQADPWRRWEAVNALGRVHREETADVLGAVVAGGGEEKDRREAVLSLGRMGGARAAGHLVRALGDASPEVRWRAAMSLGDAGDAAAAAALEKLLESETHAMTREHAEKSLAKLRAAR